ncbi:MAG: hypothetical protein ACFE9Z_05215 [Promethearchaeota archaeon]
MSIDKWLSEKDSDEQKARREEAFKQLSNQEIQELKKKKVRDIVKKEEQKINQSSERDKFLLKIIEFRNWLNQRNYLKGDLERIETWIKNLNSMIKLISGEDQKLDIDNDKKRTITKYKEIPPKFLDEKTRIALNKLIHGTQRTNSDNYYIRKIKSVLKEKLKEAEYYQTINKLFKIL